MKAIDLQCQVVTRWGQMIPDEHIPYLEKYLGTKLDYDRTDEEMAQLLRDADVKAMIVLPTMDRTDIGEIREINDRAYEFKRNFSDVIVGIWASIIPALGWKGLKELERCIKDLGFVGYYMASLAAGVPINDKSFYNYYDLCSEAGTVVRLNIGHLAAGAGTPGGGGYRLAPERPIPYFDDVAAEFPNLTLISGHCTWPWHIEMISVMLHKGNVYAENHGWAPKYVPAETKKEMNGRLQDKFMFASDYPFVSYERVFAEWEAEGLKPEVLEKMYYKNAQRRFGLEL